MRGEPHVALLCELARRDRCTVGQAMTVRKHGEEWLALEHMHGEVVLGLWRADERRIDPAVTQGAEKVRAHECPDFDADGGVLLPEPLNQPGDRPELDQWLPADHQVPRLVACDLSDRFDACIETREYLAGTVEKVGPDGGELDTAARTLEQRDLDRKSTRLNSSHSQISYAVFCLKKKKKKHRLGSSEMHK